VWGGIIALLAFGYSLICGVTGTVNLAHPVSMGIGGWIVLLLLDRGHPIWYAVIGAIVAGGTAGVIIDRIALWPGRARPAGWLGSNVSIVSSFAALALWAALTSHYHWQPHSVTGANRFELHFSLLGFDLNRRFAVGACGFVAVAGLLLLRFTRLGLAFRAVASNVMAARAAGVDSELTIATATFVASAFGAIAGLLIALSEGYFGAQSVVMPIQVMALAGLVLGGFRSPVGTVVGAYVVAAALVLPALLSPKGGSTETAIGGFLIAFAILPRFFPRGLFSRQSLRTS
jgi:branched-chain amino acid transport system permease protein